ncbi:MAG: DUF512 domain-containing protein [Clostridia bacterium]|nr:DUF512 domain-containing protein [Clostridia bacterium]
MVEITGVLPRSRAAKKGIVPGDILLEINGHAIRDVLDYRFRLAERTVCLKLHRGPELLEVTIRKDEYDDIGLEFATPLMDKKHRCENGCIFCFIDQNPAGMRESIYFKDDDSRLSFLHGNYITLTNLHDEDIDRILEMHISPVNVSVHTTNPELRVKMMKNKRSGEVLAYLRRMADAGTKLRGQIVLCRGINDGAELERTMQDLYGYYPAMDSVSVVPAGLTGYRDKLYPLEPFTPEECREVIAQVNRFGDQCFAQCGQRIFYVSDEFYIKGNVPLPPEEYYEEYTQIENGVGMLTSFENEFHSLLKMLDEDERMRESHVSVATGEAAVGMIRKLAEGAMAVCPNLHCQVYVVKNNFFGGHVTVTGLLTGKDMAEQLAGKALGDRLLLSGTTLRSEGDLFLCGMTPAELSERLGVEVCFTEQDGGAFLEALLGL